MDIVQSTFGTRYLISKFSGYFSLMSSAFRRNARGVLKPHITAMSAEINWIRFLLHVKRSGMSIADLKQ